MLVTASEHLVFDFDQIQRLRCDMGGRARPGRRRAGPIQCTLPARHVEAARRPTCRSLSRPSGCWHPGADRGNHRRSRWRARRRAAAALVSIRLITACAWRRAQDLRMRHVGTGDIGGIARAPVTQFNGPNRARGAAAWPIAGSAWGGHRLSWGPAASCSSTSIVLTPTALRPWRRAPVSWPVFLRPPPASIVVVAGCSAQRFPAMAVRRIAASTSGVSRESSRRDRGRRRSTMLGVQKPCPLRAAHCGEVFLQVRRAIPRTSLKPSMG